MGLDIPFPYKEVSRIKTVVSTDTWCQILISVNCHQLLNQAKQNGQLIVLSCIFYATSTDTVTKTKGGNRILDSSALCELTVELCSL